MAALASPTAALAAARASANFSANDLASPVPLPDCTPERVRSAASAAAASDSTELRAALNSASSFDAPLLKTAMLLSSSSAARCSLRSAARSEASASFLLAQAVFSCTRCLDTSSTASDRRRTSPPICASLAAQRRLEDAAFCAISEVMAFTSAANERMPAFSSSLPPAELSLAAVARTNS